MPNTLTDQYQLVRVSAVDANFLQNLLGKQINYNDGFCRELFRDGRHIGSIRSQADTVLAKRGDAILSVNMGIMTVPFTDKLPTRDAYVMSYDGTVRLCVWDPRAFATGYQQSIDPLQKTLDAIRAALLREVARTKHDDVSDVYLRNVVEYEVAPRQMVRLAWGMQQAAIVLEYGVAIIDAQTMIPRPDTKRKADIEEAERVQREKERIKKEEEIRLAELAQREVLQARQFEVESVINKRNLAEELELDGARQQHARDQKAQDQRYDAAVKIEITEAEERRKEDRALLRKLRADGVPTRTIIEEYPELRYLFDRRDILTGQLESPQLPQLPGSVLHAESPSSRQAVPGQAESARESYGIASEPRPDDILLSHLGIKVSRHEFNEQELTLSGAESRLAYFVVEVQSSASDVPEIRKGDFIFQIADKPVPELAELTQLLNALQTNGDPVKITFLRGDIARVAYVSIPPMSLPE